MTLAGRVANLERDRRFALDLLGEIAATFSIPRNRERLAESEHGRGLLTIADRWIFAYQQFPKRPDSAADLLPALEKAVGIVARVVADDLMPGIAAGPEYPRRVLEEMEAAIRRTKNGETF